MLRQAITNAAPSDAAVIKLCCAPQRPVAGQQSLPEVVIRAEKALEVHRLLTYDIITMQSAIYSII